MNATTQLSPRRRTTLFRRKLIRLALTGIALFGTGNVVQAIPSTNSNARSMWQFQDEYTGPDKSRRILNSFAVGTIRGGGGICSGTMISPHIFLTAAHCGGPDHATRTVVFYRIDEDAPAGTQAQIDVYRARSFPFQSFVANGRQIGDFMLWWLEDDAGGIPPGVKYGYIELSDQPTSVGDAVYSFWTNPITDISPAWTQVYSVGDASRLGTPGGPTPQYFTQLDMFTAGGASGSSVIGLGPHGHRIVGVTATGDSASRTIGDTFFFLKDFDANRNDVFDAIEFDYLTAASPERFYRLEFDTPAQRAQWRPAPGSRSSVTSSPGFFVGNIVGDGNRNVVDGLWHATARFEPNATYRISMVVYGVADDGALPYVAFRSDNAADQQFSFQPRLNQWSRVTGSVTLGDADDYRLVLGDSFNGSYSVDSIAIVAEDSLPILEFETAMERESWEYVGDSRPTSFGLDGPDDFSGLVAGPSPLAENTSNLLDRPAAAGDFNGDGQTDLVFVGQDWRGSGLNVCTLFSAVDGTYYPRYEVLGDGPGVHDYPMFAGDVDGDGLTDLIFVGQDWSGKGLNIRTKFSNGDGTFTARDQVLGDGAGVHTYPTQIGDVNGDGRSDLIFIGQGWSGSGLNVRVKLSNGDGTFTSRSQVLGDGSGVHTNPAMVGDVNGDGLTDLIFVGQNWSGGGLNVRTKLSLGDGTFTARSQVLGDGPDVHTYPSHAADFNGDGLTDLAFVGQNWSGKGLNVRVKLSNRNGTFTSRSQVLGDGSGVHTYPSLVADVDGDGMADLLFLGQNWSGKGLNIRAKLSNGNGTFTSVSQVLGDGPGVHRYPALIANPNGDSFDDILFVGEGWSGPGLNVRTLSSRGNGTFSHISQASVDALRTFSLRNRYIALEANRAYRITFEVEHIDGPLNVDHFMRIENLSGVPAAEQSWRFSTAGERLTLTRSIATGGESGNAIVYGSAGDVTYLVDNIVIEEL